MLFIIPTILLLYGVYKKWKVGKQVIFFIYLLYGLSFFILSGQLYTNLIQGGTPPSETKGSSILGFIGIYLLYKSIRTLFSKKKKESVRVKIIENP